MIQKIAYKVLKLEFGKKLLNYCRANCNEQVVFEKFCEVLKKSLLLFLILSLFTLVLIIFGNTEGLEILLAIIFTVTMSLYPFSKVKKEYKKNQMDLDIGIENLVQELSILISTGMSLDNSMRIDRKKRQTFDVMIYLFEHIENSEKKGLNISFALLSFNKIYKNKYMNKLNIIINQSKKKGSSKQAEALKNLADEIIADRKMNIKKKAETLSTKMLMPLMVSMIGIIIMIMVPIIMQFNF